MRRVDTFALRDRTTFTDLKHALDGLFPNSQDPPQQIRGTISDPFKENSLASDFRGGNRPKNVGSLPAGLHTVEALVAVSEKKMQAVVTSELASVKDQLNSKFLNVQQDFERRLEDQIFKKCVESETSFRRQVMEDLNATKRQLQEDSREDRRQLQDLERRARLAENLHTEIQGSLKEFSIRDYANLHLDMAREKKAFESHRQDLTSRFGNLQKNLVDITRQVEQQTITSASQVLELKKVVTDLVKSEEMGTGKVNKKLAKLAQQLQVHNQGHLDGCMLQLHSEWQVLRDELTGHREEASLMAKRVNQLCQRPSGISQEELEHLEKRLMELQGPALTAIGQLQLQVESYETKYKDLKSIEGRANNAILQLPVLTESLQGELQQKWESYWKQAQTQMQDWEHRLQRWEQGAQVLQDEKKVTEARLFSKMDSFEQEQMDQKRRHRVEVEKETIARIADRKKEQALFERKWNEVTNREITFKQDLQDQMEKRLAALEAKFTEQSRQELVKAAEREQEMKTYVNKRLATAENNLAAAIAQMAENERDRKSRDDRERAHREERHAREKKAHEQEVEQLRSELKETEARWARTFAKVEDQLHISQVQQESLTRLLAQKNDQDKEVRQDFESSIMSQVDRAVGEVQESVKVLRAEDEKRFMERKARDDAHSADILELERRTGVEVDRLLKESIEREERQNRQIEFENEKRKVEAREMEAKRLSNERLQKEKLQAERQALEQRLMNRLEDFLVTVNTTQEQSKLEKSQDLFGRVDNLERSSRDYLANQQRLFNKISSLASRVVDTETDGQNNLSSSITSMVEESSLGLFEQMKLMKTDLDKRIELLAENMSQSTSNMAASTDEDRKTHLVVRSRLQKEVDTLKQRLNDVHSQESSHRDDVESIERQLQVLSQQVAHDVNRRIELLFSRVSDLENIPSVVQADGKTAKVAPSEDLVNIKSRLGRLEEIDILREEQRRQLEQRWMSQSQVQSLIEVQLSKSAAPVVAASPNVDAVAVTEIVQRLLGAERNKLREETSTFVQSVVVREVARQLPAAALEIPSVPVRSQLHQLLETQNQRFKDWEQAFQKLGASNTVETQQTKDVLQDTLRQHLLTNEHVLREVADQLATLSANEQRWVSKSEFKAVVEQIDPESDRWVSRDLLDLRVMDIVHNVENKLKEVQDKTKTAEVQSMKASYDREYEFQKQLDYVSNEVRSIKEDVQSVVSKELLQQSVNQAVDVVSEDIAQKMTNLETQLKFALKFEQEKGRESTAEVVKQQEIARQMVSQELFEDGMTKVVNIQSRMSQTIANLEDKLQLTIDGERLRKQRESSYCSKHDLQIELSDMRQSILKELADTQELHALREDIKKLIDAHTLSNLRMHDEFEAKIQFEREMDRRNEKEHMQHYVHDTVNKVVRSEVENFQDNLDMLLRKADAREQEQNVKLSKIQSQFREAVTGLETDRSTFVSQSELSTRLKLLASKMKPGVEQDELHAKLDLLGRGIQINVNKLRQKDKEQARRQIEKVVLDISEKMSSFVTTEDFQGRLRQMNWNSEAVEPRILNPSADGVSEEYLEFKLEQSSSSLNRTLRDFEERFRLARENDKKYINLQIEETFSLFGEEMREESRQWLLKEDFEKRMSSVSKDNGTSMEQVELFVDGAIQSLATEIRTASQQWISIQQMEAFGDNFATTQRANELDDTVHDINDRLEIIEQLLNQTRGDSTLSKSRDDKDPDNSRGGTGGSGNRGQHESGKFDRTPGRADRPGFSGSGNSSGPTDNMFTAAISPVPHTGLRVTEAYNEFKASFSPALAKAEPSPEKSGVFAIPRIDRTSQLENQAEFMPPGQTTQELSFNKNQTFPHESFMTPSHHSPVLPRKPFLRIFVICKQPPPGDCQISLQATQFPGGPYTHLDMTEPAAGHEGEVTFSKQLVVQQADIHEFKFDLLSKGGNLISSGNILFSALIGVPSGQNLQLQLESAQSEASNNMLVLQWREEKNPEDTRSMQKVVEAEVKKTQNEVMHVGVKCSNLPARLMDSLALEFFVVLSSNPENQTLCQDLCRTETARGANPEFQQPIAAPLPFRDEMQLKFSVYTSTKKDLVGHATVTAGDLAHLADQNLEFPLTNDASEFLAKELEQNKAAIILRPTFSHPSKFEQLPDFSDSMAEGSRNLSEDPNEKSWDLQSPERTAKVVTGSQGEDKVAHNFDASFSGPAQSSPQQGLNRALSQGGGNQDEQSSVNQFESDSERDDAEMGNDGEGFSQVDENANELDELALDEVIDVLENGVLFIKHPLKRGKPEEKVLFLRSEDQTFYWCKPGKSSESKKSSFHISQVTHLLCGKQTSAFTRKQSVDVPPNRCFSIIFDRNTLNIETHSMQQRAEWMALIKYLKPSIKESGAPSQLVSRESSLMDVQRDSSRSQSAHSSAAQLVFEGQIFVKHPLGRGKPERKFVFSLVQNERIYWSSVGTRNASTKKSVEFSEISAVWLGKRTPAFRKKTAVDAQEEKCLSIRGSKRTLDLEAPSQFVRDQWADAICQLTGCDKMGGRRASREGHRLVKDQPADDWIEEDKENDSRQGNAGDNDSDDAPEFGSKFGLEQMKQETATVVEAVQVAPKPKYDLDKLQPVTPLKPQQLPAAELMFAEDDVQAFEEGDSIFSPSGTVPYSPSSANESVSLLP